MGRNHFQWIHVGSQSWNKYGFNIGLIFFLTTSKTICKCIHSCTMYYKSCIQLPHRTTYSCISFFKFYIQGRLLFDDVKNWFCIRFQNSLNGQILTRLSVKIAMLSWSYDIKWKISDWVPNYACFVKSSLVSLYDIVFTRTFYLTLLFTFTFKYYKMLFSQLSTVLYYPFQASLYIPLEIRFWVFRNHPLSICLFVCSACPHVCATPAKFVKFSV